MEMEWRAAENLITADRYDLIAKYIYVKHKIEHYDMKWAKELYAAHIEAFSGGSYQEPRQPQKNSLQSYIDSFDELIKSILKLGFDGKESKIPISSDTGSILDGAHRVAVCAYLKKSELCYALEGSHIYNYAFFKKQFLGEKYLDYMALQYINIKKEKMSVICVWPTIYSDINKLSELETLIQKTTVVVYEKILSVNTQGIKNFFYILKNKDLKDVTMYCSGQYGKVKIYLVEFINQANVREEQRKIKSFSETTLYITETYRECVNAANIFFHRETYNILCRANFFMLNDIFCKLEEFAKIIEDKGANINDFLIVPSLNHKFIDSSDKYKINYFTVMREVIRFPDANCLSTDRLFLYGKTSMYELLYNPQNYIFFRNLKIISWGACKAINIEVSRGIPLKDKIKMRFLGLNRIQVCAFFNDKKVDFERLLRNFRTRVRNYLQQHGIFIFTKLWHYIHGKGFIK